ncbi:MAG: MraY family glycosyltransferase [Prochlorococcus marinus subsp. pastoris]
MRKQNRNSVPRIGGLSIFLGIFISFVFLIINKNINLGIDNLQVFLILLMGFFLIGFIDDLYSISPWPRLSIQVALSAVAWFQNLRIEVIDLTYLNIEHDYLMLPKFISLIVTVVWIVGLTNAINWIDGLDGLAAGVTLIGVIGLLIINIKLKQFDILYILLPNNR